jgi:stage II sporulation protein AA (anti-sigma F factor antagonist)
MTDAQEALQIDVRAPSDDGVVVVALAGELDLVSSGELTDAVARIRSASPARVLVDLSALSFVDSSGINALLQAARTIAENGGQLVLAAPGPATRRIFQIARVPDLVDVVDDLDEARVEPVGDGSQ